MISLSNLVHARPAIAAFAAMGVLWGTFAAVLPDLKAMLGVDEAQLGLLIFFTPIAAISAMLDAAGAGAGEADADEVADDRRWTEDRCETKTSSSMNCGCWTRIKRCSG